MGNGSETEGPAEGGTEETEGPVEGGTEETEGPVEGGTEEPFEGTMANPLNRFASLIRFPSVKSVSPLIGRSTE